MPALLGLLYGLSINDHLKPGELAVSKRWYNRAMNRAVLGDGPTLLLLFSQYFFETPLCGLDPTVVSPAAKLADGYEIGVT
jgi:hypothetical protein